MNGQPHIDVDIPLPGPLKQHPTSAIGKLAMEMKVGNSILCDTEGNRSTVIKTISKLGGKSTVRKQEHGWRVWRIR